MQLGLKIWKWYNKMNHCFHSKSPIWASRLLQPCKKTAPHKKQTNIDCSLVILAILLLILPNNCTFFWIFAYCDCWLILQSGLIISFSRTFARLMSTKRDFIKGVLFVWIHRSLRISFWEKLTWKEEINWLLDFTKPDTICTL